MYLFIWELDDRPPQSLREKENKLQMLNLGKGALEQF